MIGGFYNWHMAFKGDFKLWGKHLEKTLENYDVLFIGISRPELEGGLATDVRRAIGWESKTKLVLCIDYAIELWQDTFNPRALENELLQADMIFVSEPAMKSWVSAIINERKPVHHIVHPSNLDAIERISKPIEIRDEELIALIHRYDNYWFPMYLVSRNVDYVTTAVMLDPSIEIRILAFFPMTKQGLMFTEYLEWASRKKVCVESYHRIHTYGRTAVDNASLQLPTVGTDLVYSQEYLWPDLTVKSGDVLTQAKLINKLFKEKEFYLDCVEKAKEFVQRYSYENRKKELLEKLYD